MPAYKQALDDFDSHTPHQGRQSHWLGAESPADTDALLGCLTPSAPTIDQAERRASSALTFSADVLPDLEIQRSGQSLSAQSCVSFNSNEGFGSPMAQGNRRRNSVNMDDGAGQVGHLQHLLFALSSACKFNI